MTKIHKLAEPHFLQENWDRVFLSDEPFGWPFVDSIRSGLLFYPTDGYHLARSQYEAMIAVAKSSGERGFLVSITEGEGNIIDRGEHWWCEYPSYDEYRSIPLVLENSIYPRNAAWGIMVSHEDHAVIGADDVFIAGLRIAYPQWQDDINKLIGTWRNNPNSSWIHGLLEKCSEVR
jgi:hypothetical protein